MIPRANITAWRAHAPWPSNEQVEQDLVLSRALVAIFSDATVATQAVFRGGTALHKLFFDGASRYSEDIDLVQRKAGPIGALIDGIRHNLDPWLGSPRSTRGKGRFTLLYRFETTFAPVSTTRLKIEINTREHFSVFDIGRQPFVVHNPWFKGNADLPVYHLDELLGTKLRALYQRKKGRDLFDLWWALRSSHPDCKRIAKCFERYIAHEGNSVSRAQFEANLATKLQDDGFLRDVRPLLKPNVAYDATQAAESVHKSLIVLLPGEPWKGA